MTFKYKQLYNGMDLFEADIGEEQPLNEYASRENNYEVIDEAEIEHSLSNKRTVRIH